MILPPQDAYSATTDETFGDVRKLLVSTPDSEIPHGVGCSSVDMRARNAASDTSGDNGACGEGELYCWVRCMPLADQGLTATTCSDQNLQLQCVNPRDQFSDGSEHGDVFPKCSNTTEPVSDYPTIVPGQGDECDAAAWETFSVKGDDYMYEFDLSTNYTSAKFMWSVVDGETVKVRLAFNGLFGWLATGFASTGLGKNAMLGGNILMAMPGGDYDAAVGLDTALPHTVKEHVISSTDTAFRHWQDPVEGSAPNADVQSTACFTALTFEMDNINGLKFNTSASDLMIWAGNGEDQFMGYHKQNRARFTVEWSSGEAYFGTEQESGASSGSSQQKLASVVTLSAVATIVYALLI